MTAMPSKADAPRRPADALFAATVFLSAALVFLVEPMVAKLVLPQLGGSASVWNTSLAFFQTALLAGYGYAHALQRLKSLKRQAIVHGVVLLAAAWVLPLRVNALFGPPSSDHPAVWLLGVLTVSIGAPFAALSATAPLVQAWHARVFREDAGQEPYSLYAASNLGSLLALLAYPLVVEPVLTLTAQRLSWSGGYLAFILLILGLAFTVVRLGGPVAAPRPAAEVGAPTSSVAWRTRLLWVVLAAIPSSLMLGVTTFITTDIASAPFLWVLPLALYLLTFVVAFQARPAISPSLTLLLQAALVGFCLALAPFSGVSFLIQLPVHLATFFLTALMCHQALVARRPPPAQLTEFDFWMSLGGVIGGGFNAFVAPVIFDNVWEYPLMLISAALIRPWRMGEVRGWTWIALAVCIAAAVASPVLNTFVAPHIFARPVFGSMTQIDLIRGGTLGLLGLAAIASIVLSEHGFLAAAALVMVTAGAYAVADRSDHAQSWRSFFGVVRQSETQVPALGGPTRMLKHGTTLHGAEALTPTWRCNPLVYYANSTPIGQVFLAEGRLKPSLRIGAVGLGTGTVSAYVRASDRLTFFEIDPLVVRLSSDPRHFAYTTRCARGPVDYVIGDARLTLAQQPREAFDLLLIDAFSSDAVPTHLLTVQAVRGYLGHLKPDGLMILHLSNRNLDLNGPAQAVAQAAGGCAMIQHFHPKPGEDLAGWPSAEDAVIISRSPAALAMFAVDKRWMPVDPGGVRPWTDDYVNLIGALERRLKQKAGGRDD